MNSLQKLIVPDILIKTITEETQQKIIICLWAIYEQKGRQFHLQWIVHCLQ